MHPASISCLGAPQRPIGFSITQATSWPESLVAGLSGTTGPEHQHILQRVFEGASEWQAPGQLSAAERLRLTAGLIWPDFPAVADSDLGGTQTLLEEIPRPLAPYLHDVEFRQQPRASLRMAFALVYAGLPLPPSIQPSIAAAARQVRATQQTPGWSNVHFMRDTADEPDAVVVSRAAMHASDWYRRALIGNDMFLLGHALHTVQDSFSPAHTRRRKGDTAIEEVYFYGHQTTRGHGLREGHAAAEDGGPAELPAKWAASACRTVLARFVTDRTVLEALAPQYNDDGKANQARVDKAAQLADAFRTEILIGAVFCLANPYG